MGVGFFLSASSQGWWVAYGVALGRVFEIQKLEGKNKHRFLVIFSSPRVLHHYLMLYCIHEDHRQPTLPFPSNHPFLIALLTTALSFGPPTCPRRASTSAFVHPRRPEFARRQLFDGHSLSYKTQWHPPLAALFSPTFSASSAFVSLYLSPHRICAESP